MVMYLSIGQLDYLGFFAFILNYRGGHFHWCRKSENSEKTSR